VRLRKSLVAFQVGLATLLLISAGLFARTLKNLERVDLGFKTENVIMFGVRPSIVYEDSRKLQVFRAMLENLKAVPGVKAVGANRSRLLTGGRWDSTITIPGVPDKPGNTPWSFFNAVTPGYFEALGIPVTQGRDFTWNDWGTDKYRCVVNQKLVDEYLEGTSPVGRMMGQGRNVTPDMEIIGVFANTRYHNVRGEVPRQTFVAMGATQRIKFITAMNVYARVEGDPNAVMPLLRDATTRTDPNLIVSDLRTMDEQLEMRLTTERMLSYLSVGFALLASLLAVVGLYGVLAFLVERRTKEIGIRMALGAERVSVVWLVLAEVALLIVVGIAAGVSAGLMSGKYVESQLFGVKAMDPVVFTMSVVLLLGASLAAGFIPAWRAARIDPIRALRYE
jgi:predicted permease